MITLRHFVFNDLGVNSFVLYDHTLECIIVDPGCESKIQQQQLIDFIDKQGLKPVSIIVTHGHFDHVFGIAAIKPYYNCEFLMHKDDLNQIEHIDKFAGMFGYMVEKSPMPDHFVSEGDTIKFGESSLQIFHVPGHSPGSICLYAADEQLLICGDVLFNGSIGRTDLPGGSHQQLITGIRNKLMILPRETIVWPGHGPSTTIGHEHDTNPFLN